MDYSPFRPCVSVETDFIVTVNESILISDTDSRHLIGILTIFSRPHYLVEPAKWKVACAAGLSN